MKVTVNKKGFTLVELLAVIALLSLILLLVVPNLTSLFNDSASKTLKIQEKEMANAGLLYLEDYCKNPIGTKICTLSKSNDLFSGIILLDTLETSNYIDEVYYKEEKCTGCVKITDNKATAYLNCPNNNYQTEGYSCN